jgi:hypothetical protein
MIVSGFFHQSNTIGAQAATADRAPAINHRRLTRVRVITTDETPDSVRPLMVNIAHTPPKPIGIKRFSPNRPRHSRAGSGGSGRFGADSGHGRGAGRSIALSRSKSCVRAIVRPRPSPLTCDSLPAAARWHAPARRANAARRNCGWETSGVARAIRRRRGVREPSNLSHHFVSR